MDDKDIERLARLIKEDPRLLNEIREITEKEDEKAHLENEPENFKKSDEIINAFLPKQDEKRRRRGELLQAMKPYLSSERQKAIESMITIADLVDIMRNS